MSRYITDFPDVDIAERAEAIFERFLGYRMASSQVSETLKRDPDKGCFYLHHTNVTEIVSVQARAHSWGSHIDYGRLLGSTNWVDIDREHVALHTSKVTGKSAIVLPPTIFGTSFDECIVVYRAGLVELPEGVTDAVLTIAALLQSNEIDEWRCMLPTTVHEVLHRYRKEGAD